MKILNVLENKDGSATISCEFDQKEVKLLIEHSVIDILTKSIKDKSQPTVECVEGELMEYNLLKGILHDILKDDKKVDTAHKFIKEEIKDRYIKKCLEKNICPDCGGTLQYESLNSVLDSVYTSSLVWLYKCNNCSFATTQHS